MAMLDCSLVYCKTERDSHANPPISPKSVVETPFPRPAPPPPAYQPQRASLPLSEPTSTTPNSENDRVFSSGDEDSIEFTSDTAYDSVGPPGTTLSRGIGPVELDFEKLFDGPPIAAIEQPTLPFEEIVRRNSFSKSSQPDVTSLGEVENLSTPRDDPSSGQGMDLVATPTASQETQSQPIDISSSPPPYFASERRRQQYVQEHASPPSQPSHLNDDSELWIDGTPIDTELPTSTRSPSLPQADFRQSTPPLLEPFESSQLQSRASLDAPRDDKRISIFDWSEMPRSDRESSLFGSSPRPRTVHSKQAAEVRSGRPTGRRPPNTLHLRSQSVPAVKESHMDSDPGYPPAKFGTWGLGNKGVSEEWTDDFDFEDSEGQATQDWPETIGTGMKVPQAIMDRQASVHGQFGQVQEFMLLVEGLKRLRHQGSILNLLDGESRQLWDDAESIINLATLNDDEEDSLPPQSPTFTTNFDDFDESSSPPHRTPSQIHSMSPGSFNASRMPVMSEPATPPAGRPRGESRAQAKTFLQTMHQTRTGTSSSHYDDRNSSPKLPFDTQDLRTLVTRTGMVTRALKDVVRRAEGVFPSPERASKEPQDPPFSQIFQKPDSLASSVKDSILPRSTSVSSYFKDVVGDTASDPFTSTAMAGNVVPEADEGSLISENKMEEVSVQSSEMNSHEPQEPRKPDSSNELVLPSPTTTSTTEASHPPKSPTGIDTVPT